MHSLKETIYYIITNLDSELIIQLTCLSFLTDKILKAFDEGLLTGMILIDLQKAFDTIDHEILFENLKVLGFSRGCITWFQPYLSEKIFFISIENQLSDYGRISCGVPQGSILAPLLFFIYVNDMPQAMRQHKDVEEIEKVLKTMTSKIFAIGLLIIN